ncbi:hypothetical protein BDU57DRAFT_513344 [Ampelomyces quisqualis]|uniref:Uncharacterized protein n=1 Tax=Ampelomyces quisqualis TaxID=50730 RepID=A0A6A5QP96_AMPQU|nr:hypothetical protein BDU57DRAFT_513344 [Ampelomyces quisqualis]
MLHPWTATVICYQCYTKKADDFSWVKCYSGHEVPHLCGERPVDINGKPITTTLTQTTASTTYVTTSIALPGTKTITHTTTTAATTPLPIQARSWHRKVSFKLPWNDVRACADAEWEKRGKPNTEIRLQDVHVANPGDCLGVPSLDLPDPIKHIDTATAIMIGTQTVGGHTAMTTITETHYTYETTLVLTFTDTGAPESEEPTTTFFPMVKTVTDLVPTVATVTTLVTDELTTTVWAQDGRTDGENERESVGDREVPPHRDL